MAKKAAKKTSTKKPSVKPTEVNEEETTTSVSETVETVKKSSKKRPYADYPKEVSDLIVAQHNDVARYHLEQRRLAEEEIKKGLKDPQ